MSVDTDRPVDRPKGHSHLPAGSKDRRVAPPPKLRRRPVLVAASIAAVCVGGLLGAFAWTASSDTRSVVAVRSAVERGAVIGREDLMAVQVGVDPALTPVPAGQVETLVGQRAAVDMAAGTLVTRDQVSATVLPPRGFSVVGVALPASLLPGEPLVTGDQVRVVATPGAGGEVVDGPPVTIPATVVGQHPDPDTGATVVSVQVPESRAAELAARAATGNVAIVLDSRER
ncbi:SAF domain-containing protein [Janibacter sp. HTCC2649]|uniref:SAF domain-containing protein n=1 Tax=Janibacter sp. HTCC2649 TaxID=313589 RepID=UPI0011D26AE6|nr:SAF domain-containing protein [Janibacter sp. HTCC2649]